MDTEGPVRPPRAGRLAKQPSSGLLISFIRTLSSSLDSAERDREKAKLERDFKRSDQNLDDLVAANHEDLAMTMQAFSKISSRIESSKNKIKTIKQKLGTCKSLLHCKRDELKKLWLESVEQKHVLQLLQEIERIMEVPEKVDGMVKKKHYLHATELLVSSVGLLEGSLEGVEALKDVKTTLLIEKEQLHKVLVDELHRHLYVCSTADVLKRYRLYGSEARRTAQESTNAVVAKLSTSTLDLPLHHSPSRRSSRDMIRPIFYNAPSELDPPIVEDISLSDPEENTSHFIAILVQCLSLLNKIPEAIESIKERCQRELMSIVHRTSQQVLDNHTQSLLHALPTSNLSHSWDAQLSTSSSSAFSSASPQLLLDLMELLFDQFRCVATAHKCVLANFRTKINLHYQPGEIFLYESADVWSKIQVVLEVLLGDHLDIHNTAATRQPAPPAFTDSASATDVASYFSRKKGFKPKSFALFRFDASSHAISMNAYFQEQKEALKEKNEFSDDTVPPLVCHPQAKNVTTVFKPLMKFVAEIEIALGLEADNHCPLHTFLIDCVKVFLGHVVMEVDHIIDSVTKSLDTWKAVSDPEILKSLGTTKPLLQSTVLLDKSLLELQEHITALPMYSDHFLGIIASIVNNYKETCQAAYRGIVQPESEDKRIISATWAQDGDISRCLRSLLNWERLECVRTNGSDPQPQEESPEEIRLRNKSEIDMLMQNMSGDTLIPPHEILADSGQLRNLALLQESMEWFGSRLMVYFKNLQVSQTPSLMPFAINIPDLEMQPQAESLAQSLQKLSGEFKNLADTCLLVLHLEVRVHCFYHLLPVVVQGSFAITVDRQEPDPELVSLNKDLSNIDEAMSSSLQVCKHRYIFEGLGHLVANILMNSVNSMKMINENGVKKMTRNVFSIQQTLSGITMSREVELDHARQYFELFYHSPEEILNAIVEHGPQFQEQEYWRCLQLYHRSHGETNQVELSELKNKLHNILNKVQVSV